MPPRRAARLAGLAGAAAFVAAVGAAMLALGDWNGELVAASLLASLPLYVVARDAQAKRKPRPPWVPPWERTIRSDRAR